MKRMMALCLAVLLAVSVTGCAAPGGKGTADLMEGVKPRPLGGEVVLDGEKAVGPTDFAVRLFRAALDGEENPMLSPVSVLYALAMTANGAAGETRTQMEQVLGMTVPELNEYLRAYRNALPEGKSCKLHIANSLWLTDDSRFTVVPDFLQTNADYYGAAVRQLPFDEAACREINDWVEDNTDGMVRDILDEIPPEAVLYLVNAVAFDAEWQEIYKDYQIRDGVFTRADGTERTVAMMHSTEALYLEDDCAAGFLKPYAEGKYAFAALLPDEGMTLEDYAASLTGKRLAALLDGARETTVYAALPKFESEYSVELSETLKTMGMTDAFYEETADLSGLGTSTAGNVYISRVLHKTFIAVDGKGTRAGAATVVEAADGGIMIEEVKEVVLDRPFLYLIIDCEANLPLFLGALTDPG